MSVINTNISALRAQNSGMQANKMLGDAMERLSTGRRLNSAADDAAGLSIATGFTSDIRALNQGIRNANDGIALAQTAEGALDEVTNMLQRVRELAIQSQNGTLDDTDRGFLNTEVTELAAQIDDILSNTQFNGVALFSTTSGTDVTVSIQIDAGRSVDLTSTGIDGTAITATALSVASVTDAAAAVGNVDNALQSVNTARSSLGAGQNRLEVRDQQPDDDIGQPDRRAFADRGHGFLGGIDRSRQGPDPWPSVHRDAGPGQPVATKRAVATALME